MVAASRVGATFGIDPVVVVDSPRFVRALRVAAYNVWVADEEARWKAATKKTGSPPRSTRRK